MREQKKKAVYEINSTKYKFASENMPKSTWAVEIGYPALAKSYYKLLQL
jgi:hypothetical protein